jgi:hypothetical protein
MSEVPWTVDAGWEGGVATTTAQVAVMSEHATMLAAWLASHGD